MYLVPVFSLIIIITLFLTKNTFHFILGNPTQEIRKIHSRPIIKIGGLSLLSISIYLFLTNDLLIINSIFFALIFFTIGLIADLRKNFNSKLRFFLMIAAILIFILVNDFKIYDLNHEFLNKIFLFSGVSTTLFIVFALMFITNGLNFIDGNNGLMLGITSLILINFNFHSYEYNSDINNYINCILLAVITLFIINFLTGKIICGDNGAYFLGFLIGTLSIILSNENIERIHQEEQ